MISDKFFERYASLFAGLIIYLSAFIVYLNIPTYHHRNPKEYLLNIQSPEYEWGNWTLNNPITNHSDTDAIGVDEFVYYHQAKVLSSKGYFDGFKFLSEEYLGNPIWNDAPPPLRIAAITANSIAVSIYDSPRAIILFCLLSFILLLAGTYLFIKQESNNILALIVVLLMSTSPLEMFVSKRALMDMPSLTALVFSCYAFWLMMKTSKWKWRITFIATMTWAILLKEANGALLPFWGLFALFLYWKKETSLSFGMIAGLIIAPAIGVGLAYEIVLGHNNWTSILPLLLNAASHSHYSSVYGNGPWSRMLIDFLLLSPFVEVLAIGFFGYVLFTQKADRFTTFVLAMGIYLLVYLNFLPKNVRYSILFDFVLRFSAANALFLFFSIYNDNKQRLALAILLVVLVAVDLNTFYVTFVQQTTYDPTSYALLFINKIIHQ